MALIFSWFDINSQKCLYISRAFPESLGKLILCDTCIQS